MVLLFKFVLQLFIACIEIQVILYIDLASCNLGRTHVTNSDRVVLVDYFGFSLGEHHCFVPNYKIAYTHVRIMLVVGFSWKSHVRMKFFSVSCLTSVLS